MKLKRLCRRALIELHRILCAYFSDFVLWAKAQQHLAGFAFRGRCSFDVKSNSTGNGSATYLPAVSHQQFRLWRIHSECLGAAAFRMNVAGSQHPLNSIVLAQQERDLICLQGARFLLQPR